jgi:hypothetical protein
MTLKQARKELEKLGFKFSDKKFGTMPPEDFTNDLIKNNHWKPEFRSVYIASDYPIGGPYITSSIHGKYRRFRAHKHNEYRREFGNIFAHGKTLKEAIDNFVKDFKVKKYNVSE